MGTIVVVSHRVWLTRLQTTWVTVMGTSPCPASAGRSSSSRGHTSPFSTTAASSSTVNDAWHRFGRENGLDPVYRFAGVSYLDVCERAIAAKHGNEGASDALGGINRILAAEEKRFSLVYPCHAPDKQRWFLMYARPIGPGTDGAVVSHVDVTSLHLAGFVPDETESPPGAPADAPSDAPSSRDGADKLAQLLFADRPNPLAANPPRLR